MSADIEAKDLIGRTALVHAVQNRHSNIIQLLINHSTSVKTKGSQNWTLLLYTIKIGNKFIIQLLLAQITNVTTEDNKGMISFI